MVSNSFRGWYYFCTFVKVDSDLVSNHIRREMYSFAGDRLRKIYSKLLLDHQIISAGKPYLSMYLLA